MGFNKSLLLIISLSCLIIHTIAAVRAPSAAPSLGGAWRSRVRSPKMMVSNLCRNITNTPLCIKTILPAMKAPFNPFNALVTEILVTRGEVAATQGKIDILLLKPMMSKDLNDSLYICKDQFSNMVDSIKQTLISLASTRSPTEAKYQLSSVMSYLETCRDEFNKNVNPSPIGREAAYLYDLGSNCLDIIKKLEDKEMKRILKRFGGKLPPPPPAVSFKNDPCFGVIGICGNY